MSAERFGTTIPGRRTGALRSAPRAQVNASATVTVIERIMVVSAATALVFVLDQANSQTGDR